MAPLDNKLFELKTVLWSMNIYTLVLDLITGFAVFSVILQFLGYALYLAIFPAIIVVMIQFIQQFLRYDVIGGLRKRGDGLEQQLQTALENRQQVNPIVDDLVADVTKRLDSVETSNFFSTKEVSLRIYITIIACFLLITVTAFNLKNLTFNSLEALLENPTVRDNLKGFISKNGTGFETVFGNPWEQANWTTDQEKDKLGAKGGGDRPGVSEGPIPGKGGGTGTESARDIYGDASSASLFGNDVDFKMHPEYGGEIEIKQTGANANNKKFELGEVSSVEECADCIVGPENEEMVRRYFEKILPDS